MSRPLRTRSAKGEVVDFDLLFIKSQIGAKTPPVEVSQRKDFIDKRLRRRTKKAMEASKTMAQETAEKDSVVVPEMPTSEGAVEIIEEEEKEAAAKKIIEEPKEHIIKQKAKRE